MMRRAPRWTAGESGAARRMPPSPCHALPMRTAGKTNGRAAEARTWSTVKLRPGRAVIGAFVDVEVAALHPAHGLARRVVERHERQRREIAGADVFLDAGDGQAVGRPQDAAEQVAQRPGVDEPVWLAAREAALLRQQRSESGAERQERSSSRTDRSSRHSARTRSAPAVARLLEQRSLMGGQVDGIDRSRRDAGDDADPQIGEMAWPDP